MSKSFSESYKAAGVDVTAGYKAVELMKEHIRKTGIPGVLSSVGGFSGMFELDIKNINKPVLVSGTDGVGTKLKIAFMLNNHSTVGQDCVAMCVNDVLCVGAKPLFFLDYIALGKNFPQKVADIVKGISDGCVLAGCALIGGETAEMPGFYPIDEYDLAGFTVGIVDKEKIIDGSKVKSGDKLIGLASSGVHSNGFSLIRKVFQVDISKVNMNFDELGCTLGEELIKPTKIYVKSMLAVINEIGVNAVSHITGGGFYENIPRMLPNNLKAVINKNSFPILPIFELIKSTGNISERDMFNTFNMGIGMVIAVDSEKANKAINLFDSLGEKAYIIGEVVEGENGIEIN